MTPTTESFQSLNQGRKPSCELLICIYTCEQHRHLLKEFYSSIIGQYLRDLTGAKILEVYADPEISHSNHRGSELILRTVEEYEALSLKTQLMMEYCVHYFDFNRLLKIDVTTVMKQFDSPEYEGRKAIDLEKVMFFLQNSPVTKDYNGFLLHAKASRRNAENWAAKKGLAINFQKLFGNGPMPPFFSGKCYLLSRSFVEYICIHGRKMAEEHMEFFPGAEDLMIGRLHKDFQKKFA